MNSEVVTEKTMAPPETTKITTTEETKEFKIPFLSEIPKFLLGFLNRGGNVDAVAEKSTAGRKAGEGTGEDFTGSVTPNVVSFPWQNPEVEPLKLEFEDAEQSSNPAVLWQVYALGGYILIKWAWMKWQERQADAKKRNSADNQPPPDVQPPSDD